MESPKYRNKPIGSISSLAKALKVSEKHLRKVAERKDQCYRLAKTIIKDDGSLRLTYDSFPILKDIQKRINKFIFSNVCYPLYLQGAIKKRDYVTNCKLHVKSTMLVSMDISNFFPSISDRYVKKMWQYLFNFPPVVADMLTSLTTYNGFVPQGAPTSSYIANLIFYDEEPTIVDVLKKRGIKYSRFIDDITISSKRKINAHEIGKIVTRIYGMIIKHGGTPNRKKFKKSDGRKAMFVHKVIVNGKRPSLPRSQRSNIRAMVKTTENRLSKNQGYLADKLYNSVAGKIGKLSRFHPAPGKKLRARLKHRRKPVLA